MTGVKNAADRVMGTAAVTLWARRGDVRRRLSAEKGAQMVRVHDVKQTKEILDMYYGICKEHSSVCYKQALFVATLERKMRKGRQVLHRRLRSHTHSAPTLGAAGSISV